MKKLYPFLMALCAATILSPAVASSSIAPQADAADAAVSRPAAKNPVTPHNHMRDGKGMSIPAKPSEVKKDPQPAGEEGETPKPVPKKKVLNTKKPRPHSHPQDGKGMYVPDKK
jgi:hypothetical protein